MKIGPILIQFKWVGFDSRRRNIRRWLKEPVKMDPWHDADLVHKVNAIRKYRNTYGVGLSEAKEAVEAVMGEGK